MTIAKRVGLVVTFVRTLAERMTAAEREAFAAEIAVKLRVELTMQGEFESSRPETIPDAWSRYVEEGLC